MFLRLPPQWTWSWGCPDSRAVIPLGTSELDCWKPVVHTNKFIMNAKLLPVWLPLWPLTGGTGNPVYTVQSVWTSGHSCVDQTVPAHAKGGRALRGCWRRGLEAHARTLHLPSPRGVSLPVAFLFPFIRPMLASYSWGSTGLGSTWHWPPLFPFHCRCPSISSPNVCSSFLCLYWLFPSE